MTYLKLESVQRDVFRANSALNYRPDIDGLRALAVTSVVLYHAFPSLLGGGFIGVDIFFVISGYLISSILLGDLKRGRFSIRDFYQRRILRIFPALLAVLVSCLLFGWLALLAGEYEVLAKHTLSGAGFFANLTYWSEASYFDVAAEAKPLLHLWSLGVEEQFYLVWPIILFLLWRTSHRPVAVIAIIAAASFGLNVFQASHNPTADFYSPLTRFWELLIGALIACRGGLVGASQSVRDGLSVLGSVLLITGFLVINNKDQFPGLLALIPVTGAAMLIACGAGGVVNRLLLAGKIPVAIGLISYPLYLWHWPLLAFSRVVESTVPPVGFRIFAVVLSVLLAVITYRYIERPIRQGKRFRRLSTVGLSIGMIAVALFAVVIYKNDGFSMRTGANPVVRYPADLGRDPYLTYISNNFSRCVDPGLLHSSVLDTGYGYRCFQSKADLPIEVLLLGDSHAEHWLPGLSAQLVDVNVGSLIQPDLPSLESSLFKDVIPIVANDKNIRTVIISAMWSDKISRYTPHPEQQIKTTVEALSAKGKKVYILDDIPAYSFGAEKCMYGRRFSSGSGQCQMGSVEYEDQKSGYLKALQGAVKNTDSVSLISISQFFCVADKCSMLVDGKLMYRDSNHLNIEGSKVIIAKLMNSGLSFGP
jgi:peptidoglycan/LPS O-acetylase OafA/YrhL